LGDAAITALGDTNPGDDSANMHIFIYYSQNHLRHRVYID